MFILAFSLSILLGLISVFFCEKAFCMGIGTKTYIIIRGKSHAGGLQSLAVKRAVGLSLKKAVKRLIGKKQYLNKNNIAILKKEVFPYSLKYIYSFKIFEAKRYLNLYYIDLNVYIRKKTLIRRLKNSGFKIILRRQTKSKKNRYGVFYVKFIGNFSYADSNKFQKLMIKYSKHLKNLYISSFSGNFAEIKVLYYGNIIRLLKRIKPLIRTYLKAKIYPAKNGLIIVEVK